MNHPRQFVRVLLLHKQIDIACICETFLKIHLTLYSHPSFRTYRLDRDETNKGGLAILIRNNISHTLTPIIPCKTIENLAVEVSTGR